MKIDMELRIKMMDWELTANTYGSEMYEAIFYCKHDDNFYLVKWDFDFDTVPFENVVDTEYEFNFSPLNPKGFFLFHGEETVWKTPYTGNMTVEPFTGTDNRTLLNEHEDWIAERGVEVKA